MKSSSGNTEHKDAQADLVKSEEIVTKVTIDSIEVTSRSYPSGLAADTEIATKTDDEVVAIPGSGEPQPANEVEEIEEAKDAAPAKDTAP